MIVADILKTKGSDVTTVRPDATALELSERLRAECIGAAIVSSDGRAVEGIVSERDIAYALAAHASRLPTILVAQLMTEAVVSCRYQDSINDVMGVMTQKRIRHLPVKRGNDLAGLISIGDVLKHRLSEMKLEAEVLLDYARAQR